MPPNYQKIAEQAAKRHGIGNWFVRQIKQESGFDPNAKSYAGARGIAQIVPKYHPDAPPMSDPVGQLDWAAKYMSGLVKKYGNAAQALSVYNSGQPDKYLDPNFSNGQTYNYVKNILGKDRKGGGGGGVAPAPGGTQRVTIKPPKFTIGETASPFKAITDTLTENLGYMSEGMDPRESLSRMREPLLQSWMTPQPFKMTFPKAEVTTTPGAASAPMTPGKVGKIMAPLTTPLPGN